MSLDLIVQPSAKHAIADAGAYYAQHGKADAFIAASIRHSRRSQIDLIRRFPYSVFFVVERTRTVVLAVHHQRRDPASRPRR
jgi:hypothetical protein